MPSFLISYRDASGYRGETFQAESEAKARELREAGEMDRAARLELAVARIRAVVDVPPIDTGSLLALDGKSPQRQARALRDIEAWEGE